MERRVLFLDMSGYVRVICTFNLIYYMLTVNLILGLKSTGSVPLYVMRLKAYPPQRAT
jgi:hypothetical protein